jgi:hypothetical protein
MERVVHHQRQAGFISGQQDEILGSRAGGAAQVPVTLF